ncbi:uncharacterized protein LOC111405738 isoform X2 [Olea europaea var. sylvestris]|uniref:uncharacterized protein LOC111405738 isoform X2 n=1 Tax=Olea europaea var. sylvestris TaxID=158386 RepID=UPI000C1D065D|nr:uncharacterized protein LOC111405738 isoform X2 [Olea europaea var. sylvestris]
MIIYNYLLLYMYAESAMNKNSKPPKIWKLPVLVLELSSLHTETAYRDGAMKRETQFVKFVYRGSSEIPRREAEEENGDVLEIDDYSQECNSASHTSAASYCRSMAVTFTFLLLMRHSLGVLTAETGDYPFSLFTLLIVKASGILLPMYILIQLINKIQSSLKQHDQSSDNVEFSSDDEESYESGRFNNIEIQSQ